jgi:tRNA nucleotidyltransferase (CCA-adding enzyme)
LKIYLVGGAVRDFLLAKLQGVFKSYFDEGNYWGKAEKDWVVVGSTPDEMVSLGYRPVGKSFPVFLHPKTQEEYALARTERKVGKGYKGFECYADSNVVLIDDLKRRDLTINAIAAPANMRHITLENVIDPYQGVSDLKNKVFKHVSEAFIEDPVRILRVARLACRFPDFTIHPSTQRLISRMVSEGEVDALVPERVWQEWFRSLSEKAPWRWLEILVQCKASDKLFPFVKQSNVKKKALALAVNTEEKECVRFALELFDLNEQEFNLLVTKYRIPTELKDLASIVVKFSSRYLHLSWEPLEVLTLFEITDAFRRPERFYLFLTTCNLLEKATKKDPQPSKMKILWYLLNAILYVDSKELIEKGFKGKEIAEEIRKIRLTKITDLMVTRG